MKIAYPLTDPLVSWALPRNARGTYVLVLRLPEAATLRVGRLGRVHFVPGYYAYAGSALGPGGLTARLKHHMNTAKRPWWHLDYLRTAAVPVEAWVVMDTRRREHHWADVLGRLDPDVQPVPGFGCSDCTCATHLFRYESPPAFERFRAMAQHLNPGQPPVVRVAVAP